MDGSALPHLERPYLFALQYVEMIYKHPLSNVTWEKMNQMVVRTAQCNQGGRAKRSEMEVAVMKCAETVYRNSYRELISNR